MLQDKGIPKAHILFVSFGVTDRLNTFQMRFSVTDGNLNRSREWVYE